MPPVQAFEMWQRWYYWCAKKLRAVTGTRHSAARRLCCIVIGLMFVTAALLALLVPLKNATTDHVHWGKTRNTACSIGYIYDNTFFYQSGSGFTRNNTHCPQNGPCTEDLGNGSYYVHPIPAPAGPTLSGIGPPSLTLYNMSTDVRVETPPPTIGVECWFIKVDMSFTTVELTCTTSVRGNMAKKPSPGRVNLPDTSSLVIAISGAKTMVLNDTDTPEIVVATLGGYRGLAASTYSGISLPYEVRVSVFLQNVTYTSGGNRSYEYGPVWNGFEVRLWHPYMPVYQVQNDSCTQVLDGNYTVYLTGYITMDSMLFDLLTATSYMTWSMCVIVFVLTVMLCIPHGKAPMEATTLLSFSTTLLFALPIMRALWPAPLSSTAMDAMGIFPQLLVVSFAVIAQLLYITLWQPAGSTMLEASPLLPTATADGRHHVDQARDALPLARDSFPRRQLITAGTEHRVQHSLHGSLTI